MRSPLCCQNLEVVLHCELNLTIVVDVGGLNSAECGAAKCRVRVVEARIVGQIESLSAKLKILSLVYCKAFHQGQVHIFNWRTLYGVSSCVAKSAGRRKSKASGVEPASWSAGAVKIGVCDLVRPLIRRAYIGPVGRESCGQRISGLQRENAAEL